MSYIEVKGASVIYNADSDNQVDALMDIDLGIEQGEFVVFFGPSGCGKTTLLNLISGLEKPTRGAILIDGEDISTFDADAMSRFHCEKIGMVFQAYNLIPSLSVLDNVVLPRIFLGDADVKGRKIRARSLLDRFGVAGQAQKFPAQLSGGQQQRVGIARSLINDQPVILADEPVGNLDSKSAEIVLGLLRDLNEKEQKTVIMVTHNAEHLAFADHVFYLKDGRITNETFARKKEADFKTLKPEEKEFELLARSFTGLSEAQMNVLVVPFKAKVLVDYLSNSLDFNQHQRLEELVAGRLSDKLDADKFAIALDRPLEKGGAGLNFRVAKSYALRIEELYSNVRILQGDLGVLAAKLGLEQDELKAKLLVRYLIRTFRMGVATEQIHAFERIVLGRFTSELDNEATFRLLDVPLEKGGMGLDVRLARKISRELELLLLLKFSQSARATGPEREIVRGPGRDLNLMAEDLKHIEDLVNARI